MSAPAKNVMTDLERIMNQNPELRSYIWQAMSSFEDFVTEATTIAVVARDPSKLKYQFEAEGKEIDPEVLKRYHRIAIVLKEDGGTIEAEGFHLDVFEAVAMAQKALLKKLEEIQDSIVSQQDRMVEINHYLNNSNLH